MFNPSSKFTLKFTLPAIVGYVALFPAQVLAVTDGTVERLRQQCEAAREEALVPIRAERTQTCIDQQLRSPEHCEQYYSTYGNVTPGPSGAPQPGLFYDLPPCQEWQEAREELRQSRSR